MYKDMYYFLSGILIGTFMILPGVSGSVVAIMLGIYQEVIFLFNSNNHINYKIRKMLPLAIGIIIGVFIFGKIILVFYNKYTFYMMYVFIGFILGSIPILVRDIKEKNESVNIRILLISFFISIILFLLPKIFNFELHDNLNFINLFIGGFLYISGKIIPGISSSFFLMMLGLYNYFLELITNPFSLTLKKLIGMCPFLLGIILGLFIFIKLINYLLNKYFSKTYSGIIGFIVGSVVGIYPGVEFSIYGIFAIILMILSFVFVNKLSKNSQKK